MCIARGDLYQLSRWADQWTAGLAQEWAEQARSLLEACEAEFEVEIADGNAAPVLIDRTTHESLLVVGSRGRGVFDGIAVGSVAQHVTRYASGPVVVVRQTATPSSRRVVVGADDLPEGLGAVDWAADFASARGMDLCVAALPGPARARLRPRRRGPARALPAVAGAGDKDPQSGSSWCEHVTRV